ncbi:hypothetical protein [Mycoplasma seminis]|uniref:Uncharacterized protein n=1 Tax=Mycoplasma seminis TaxID=512749 RepID=A0ABY9HB60_9MOLU|nr:hypothetical protein [Mycoplasma seminis]WLP85706.1 hypothetical protein Q8852_00935 [Mycoplasma seminis]
MFALVNSSLLVAEFIVFVKATFWASLMYFKLSRALTAFCFALSKLACPLATFAKALSIAVANFFTSVVGVSIEVASFKYLSAASIASAYCFCTSGEESL